MQKIDVELVENPTPAGVERGICDRGTVMALGGGGRKIPLCAVARPVADMLGLEIPEQLTRVSVELTEADIEAIEKGRIPDALGVQIQDKLAERERARDDEIVGGVKRGDREPIEIVEP